MSASSTVLAYSPWSKAIHWFTALCVLMVIPMGLVMDRISEGPLQDQLFDLHRSFGVLVFALALLRLGARRMLGTPAPLDTLTPFERRASVGAHHSLIALTVAMPLIGWVMMSAYPADVPFFGLFNLPHVMPANKTVYEALAALHKYLGWLMALVIAAHAGGALMHAVIKRDSVLQRMLPDALAKLLDDLQAVLGAAKKSR